MKTTKLRIHTWPERILRKKLRQVRAVDSRVRNLLEEMSSFMHINDGVGLAANQVGLDAKLIVVQWQDKLFKLANPKIIKRQGITKFCEGCLSFPGLELEVKRAEKVWVSGLDENNQDVDLELEGVLAIIFQHEIDHVNGIVFIDRISLLERLKAAFKLKEISRRTRNALRKQGNK
ncbi:MAG: peptide deformylase [Candidatus Omnitrophica bacterium]|nr:peptide deformylase [Candidatus Omnitrophota bacterium]MDD5430052.1 peptide deformylase [Candidatus Omnitrophota bacterium]